ncbi:hypothetical protein [Novosphingobium sp. Leaf2]|uniref:hypothetical protein n=1 Tax=Novosphingobium sp. Leaf2 TaxID=1735670 RepID=UPI0012E2B145|nr:hypothetical protein [Novosphingobium sp. Leaf2]
MKTLIYTIYGAMNHQADIKSMLPPTASGRESAALRCQRIGTKEFIPRFVGDLAPKRMANRKWEPTAMIPHTTLATGGKHASIRAGLGGGVAA